jgi:hypothetical protein
MKKVEEITLKIWVQNIPSSVTVGSFLLRNPRVKFGLYVCRQIILPYVGKSESMFALLSGMRRTPLT